MRTLRVSFLVAIVACSARSPGTSVVFTSGTHTLRLRVEVAATPVERQRGLMGRPSIPSGTGMLFDYQGQTSTGGYWMKDTLVPLDIAFIRSGRITEIDPMTPCRADPCPLTVPPKPYDQVVEAPAGTFGPAGIAAGAAVVLET